MSIYTRAEYARMHYPSMKASKGYINDNLALFTGGGGKVLVV